MSGLYIDSSFPGAPRSGLLEIFSGPSAPAGTSGLFHYRNSRLGLRPRAGPAIQIPAEPAPNFLLHLDALQYAYTEENGESGPTRYSWGGGGLSRRLGKTAFKRGATVMTGKCWAVPERRRDPPFSASFCAAAEPRHHPCRAPWTSTGTAASSSSAAAFRFTEVFERIGVNGVSQRLFEDFERG